MKYRIVRLSEHLFVIEYKPRRWERLHEPCVVFTTIEEAKNELNNIRVAKQSKPIEIKPDVVWEEEIK